jgi:hypothetical protein
MFTSAAATSLPSCYGPCPPTNSAVAQSSTPARPSSAWSSSSSAACSGRGRQPETPPLAPVLFVFTQVYKLRQNIWLANVLLTAGHLLRMDILLPNHRHVLLRLLSRTSLCSSSRQASLPVTQLLYLLTLIQSRPDPSPSSSTQSQASQPGTFHPTTQFT